MEKWKDIKGYEELYQVSDLGRIRRKNAYVKTSKGKRFCEGRILKLNLKKNGYLSVDLSKENRVKTISVHKLVAVAFCENFNNGSEIDHINCNKQDNRACNLEWVTPRENKDRALQNHLYYNPNKKIVYCVQLNITFESSYKAAEYLNNKYFGNTKKISSMSGKIRACCLGNQKIAYGFNWQYV